jgi:hypothetical protein
VALSLVILSASCSSGDHAATDPIERAAATLHVDADLARYTLDPTDDGGSIAIGIDDEFASTQIQLVRSFLRAQQARLARGDAGGLRALLGDDAPGLAAIARGHADLRIAYVDVADGARLVLRSTRPAVVAAIHRMLDDVLRRFGNLATVPSTEPPTSSTSNGPKVPGDFLG